MRNVTARRLRKVALRTGRSYRGLKRVWKKIPGPLKSEFMRVMNTAGDLREASLQHRQPAVPRSLLQKA